MLIRFDGDDIRGPSADLWHGVVDWIRGSLAASLGQRDFEDFAPFLGWSELQNNGTTDGTATNGGTQITSNTATPTAALQTDRFGIINITEAAASNEAVGLAREIWYDLQASPVTVIEARVEQIADADSPIAFVGFSDAANPDEVFTAGVLDGGSNEDTIGLRWNADETIDIVAVDNGTLTVLKDDIGVTVLRTDGPARLGLRIEKVTSSTYRTTPCVNGVIARSGAVNVAATLLPENPMRPVVAETVSATTAPQIEVDWIYSADK
jgi:hypothetical protein